MVIVQEYCIRCGMCVDLCPDMFSYDPDEDRIIVAENADDPANKERLKQMVADCAVGAIVVKR